jgi:hypothetical protein
MKGRKNNTINSKKYIRNACDYGYNLLLLPYGTGLISAKVNITSPAPYYRRHIIRPVNQVTIIFCKGFLIIKI